MVAALKLPAFLAGLGLFALGCSDARRTVLQTRAEGPGGPGTPGVVLGECKGIGIDCITDPQIRPYQPGPAIQCGKLEELGQGSLVWTEPLPEFVCENAPCISLGSSIAVSTASLTAVGHLSRQSDPMSGGVGLAQFSLEGALLAQSMLEPGVGSRVSEEESVYFAGTDAAGDVYVLEKVGDIDHASDAALARYRIEGAVRSELAAVQNIANLQATIAKDGSFALAAAYLDENAPDPIDFGNNPDRYPKRLDIARFDHDGRLLWNQTKLSRALELTSPFVVGFDSFGNLVVLLSRDTDLSIMFSDRSVGGLAIQRLARVDPKGNVSWVWDIPTSSTLSFAVTPNGGVYMVRHPLERRADGYYEFKPPVLEYLEPTGQSGWVLEVPSAAYVSPIVKVNARGNAVLTMIKEDAGTQSAHLLTVQQGTVGVPCTSFELPPETCPREPGSATCSPPQIDLGPENTFYFATTSSIGRFAPP